MFNLWSLPKQQLTDAFMHVTAEYNCTSVTLKKVV